MRDAKRRLDEVLMFGRSQRERELAAEVEFWRALAEERGRKLKDGASARA